jgi:hypothetical protein
MSENQENKDGKTAKKESKVKIPVDLGIRNFDASNLSLNFSKNIESLYSSVWLQPNYPIWNRPTSETEEKINKLQKEIEEKDRNLKELVRQKNVTEEEFKNLSSELTKKLELQFLLMRIHPNAINILLDNTRNTLSGFTDNEIIEMTVISIDIRKSTELMLKISNPDDYAIFISGLTEGLKDIVIKNYGVFDKFTGDGILAYFPIFYSGENGILNACLTAQMCHTYFAKYYKKNNSIFQVLLETGLGIGIDHGNVKIVKINGEQTIVGSPVVYACRFSGAPANHTYLNNIANSKIGALGLTTKRTNFELKNEGIVVAYDLPDINYKEIIIP